MFPILKVIDACGSGSAGRLSKLHLWKLFSLDSLNEQLLSNPYPAELTYGTPTRHRLGSELYSVSNHSVFHIVSVKFLKFGKKIGKYSLTCII